MSLSKIPKVLVGLRCFRIFYQKCARCLGKPKCSSLQIVRIRPD